MAPAEHPRVAASVPQPRRDQPPEGPCAAGDHNGCLADRFEEHRSRLKAVAYRMLGSLTEADDAVQDAWLRLSRSGAGEVENLGGWLTTIVARGCLNMLCSRNVRGEKPFGGQLPALGYVGRQMAVEDLTFSCGGIKVVTGGLSGSPSGSRSSSRLAAVVPSSMGEARHGGHTGGT